MKLIPLLEVNNSIITIMETEVAHEGTISKIHINVAKAKMAITLCCTIVSPSMPNALDGKFHKSNVAKSTIADLMMIWFLFDG